jgi:hypothetical protein
MTEEELEMVLEKLDGLVASCVSGQLTIDQFFEEYGYPTGEYALDGHESDEDERRVLRKHEKQIKLHFEITEVILHQLCTREQATENAYRKAGRIGPDEALVWLKQVAAKYCL